MKERENVGKGCLQSDHIVVLLVVIIGIICEYISTNLNIYERGRIKVLQIMVSIMNTKF